MASPPENFTFIIKNSYFFVFLTLFPLTLSSPLSRLPQLYSPDIKFISNNSYSFPDNAAKIPLGQWETLQNSIGISAMHMQLLYNDHIIIFDRTDFGPSNLTLPSDKCNQSDDGTQDCTAHSVIYDVASNTFQPLTILTDTWCSSGSVDPAGMLIQTGGFARGERMVRTFTPCDTSSLTCDWRELNTSLGARRWYASNHILPEGNVIVVGGRGSPNYEFFPSNNNQLNTYPLKFLHDTWDGKSKENNLYPFLHLLPNNYLYIFANNRSIEFDYINGKIVREFPIMPSGDKRNYPSTGSSVLLPISGNYTSLEILICGGAKFEAFDLAKFNATYAAASKTCGRMVITDPNPHWIIEEMPMPRVMSDMVMLPTGDILIVNGAGNGTAGWENAVNPALNPVLYRVNELDPTRKFVVLNPSRTPRLYHSSAVLVADGRVVVGGSNPHVNYNFTAKYPTELSLEGFSPPYLDPEYATLRPSILAVETEGKVVKYGQEVGVNFVLKEYRKDLEVVINLILPPFTTHSFGMNQRLVNLGGKRLDQLSESAYKVTVRVPENVNVAPPGYYMLFVVHAGVPSHGVWVQLKRPT